MNRWSHNSRNTLIAGISLILLTNLIVLAGVFYNRSGEPSSQIQMTERELQIPWYSYNTNHENSGISVRLNWRVYSKHENDSGYYSWRSPSWLDEAKLVELGFDTSQDRYAEEGRRAYNKMLSRDVLLVLEYDGPAWQQTLAAAESNLKEKKEQLAFNPDEELSIRQLESTEERVRDEKTIRSRLFAVDAGLDYNQLRGKYASKKQYLIIEGQVSLSVGENKDGTRELYGRLSGVSVENLHIPYQYAKVLENILSKTESDKEPWRDHPPRYRMMVHWGKRLEPWVTEVSTLNLDSTQN